MEKSFYDKSLGALLFQRNVFAGISLLLATSVLAMSFFLFTKRERIIVTPAVIEKSFWVEGSDISATYLEQFGVFIGPLILSKSPQSASTQRTILLRHTTPSFYGVLKKKLIEEEEKLHQQNASYTFFPIEVTVNPNERKVFLRGERVFYVSGKQVSSDEETYTLSFIFSGGRLLLDGVSASESNSY